MKKIALFGASGSTGGEFLQLALNAGFNVNALVRNPEKITTKTNKLTIIQGDVLNATDVQKTVQGSDIVVSLFGHVKGSEEWLQTNGTKNIISAMKLFGVPKIISLSGGGLPFPEKDEPKIADKIIRTIMKIVVPKILNDAIAHHKVLAESGLNWTIVRGARLTNDPKSNQYKVGWVGLNATTITSRADLADFILKQVDDDTFDGQMPFVSS